MMTLLFFLAIALLGSLMKLTAMLMPCRGVCTGRRFVCSPVLAPSSLDRLRPVSKVGFLIARGLLFAGLFAVARFAYWRVVDAFELRGAVLSYLVVPFPLMLGEVLHCLIVLLWLPSGHLLPTLFRNPFAATSLADFWGRRWNLWFVDWFRYVIFDRMRSRPAAALLLVFAVSGWMHELVVNLPLWWLTRRNLFGTMMFYFMLQGIGVWFEHRVLSGRRTARRLFAWTMVIGPVPLMLNEGLLRGFGLWPE